MDIVRSRHEEEEEEEEEGDDDADKEPIQSVTETSGVLSQGVCWDEVSLTMKIC